MHIEFTMHVSVDCIYGKLCCVWKSRTTDSVKFANNSHLHTNIRRLRQMLVPQFSVIVVRISKSNISKHRLGISEISGQVFFLYMLLFGYACLMKKVLKKRKLEYNRKTIFNTRFFSHLAISTYIL
jgi:hypothetical protein